MTATRLVFLGPPGAGKGTQADLVADSLGIPHISTGDILREAMEKKTDLGGRAGRYVEGGDLVPDEIVLSLVEERTGREDCAGGFVLDGFPRTVAQAEGLDGILAERGEALDAVILLDVGDEAIISRLAQRRVCPACGALYSLDGDPPRQDGVCDKCGARLEARVDDDPATVKKRLEVYRRDTLPVVEYYESEGLLRRVGGEGDVEGVFSSILEVLKTVKR